MRLQTSVANLHSDRWRVHEIELDSGERLRADMVVSTIPTEIYLGLAPDDAHAAASGYPLQRPAVDGLRIEEGGRPRLLLDESRRPRPRRLRHLPAQLAESFDRRAGRLVRQLRHAPQQPDAAVLHEVRG